MAFGWIIAALGLLLAVFPRPLVVAARGWRMGAPDSRSQGAMRAARIGAVAAALLGLVIALA